MVRMSERLTVTLDHSAMDALRTLADAQAEGNQSRLLRQILRQEAARLETAQKGKLEVKNDPA